MSTNPLSILTKLGYDGKDLRAGLLQAKQDVAAYKAAAVDLEQQLLTARRQLLTEYSAANRTESQQRLKDAVSEQASLRGSLASLRGAQQTAARERLAELKTEIATQVDLQKSYQQQVATVQNLAQAYQDAALKAKTSQAAAGVFKATGQATGVIPSFTDALQGASMFAPGLSQISALASAALNPITALAAGVTAVGVAIFKAGDNAGAWAKNLEDLSYETGLSTQQLQGLEYVGKTTGLSLDDMTTATKKLAQTVTTGNPVLAQLGIPIKDANGNFRSLYDVLLDVSGALQKVPTETEKVRIATELLGKGGQRLLETLSKGPEVLRALFEEGIAKGPQNVQELADAFTASQKASADLDEALLKLESRFSSSMGIWATAKEKLADFLDEQTKGRGLLPSILFNPNTDKGVGTSPAPLPSSLLSGFSAANKSLAPQSGLASGFGAAGSYLEAHPVASPIQDSSAIADLREKVSAAGANDKGQGYTVLQQIVAARQKLNELQQQNIDLTSKQAQGYGVEAELKKVLEEEVQLKTKIAELDNQQEEHFKKVASTLKAPKANGMLGYDVKQQGLAMRQEGVPDLGLGDAGFDVPTMLQQQKPLGGKQPAAPSPSGFQEFLSGLHDYTDIIGKFGNGLDKHLVQMAAIGQSFEKLTKDMSALSATKDASGNITQGSLFGGIKDIFSGTTKGPNGQSTPMSLGQQMAGVAGIAGTIVSSVTSVIGIFTNLFTKAAQKTAENIKNQVKAITDAYTVGSVTLSATITALQNERATAIQQFAGQKGGQKELQSILPSLDSQIAQLQKQQKDILNSFQAQTAMFSVSPGAQQYASTIQQIAQTLKDAAGAGATAAQQIAYLNGAMSQLKTTIGKDLQNDEQNVLSLLMQQVDLQKQRQQILISTAQQEQQVYASLGLARSLTPGQSAALQIKQIEINKTQQLQALDQQQAMLTAQLGTQQSLFNINLTGLTVDQQRQTILQDQVLLQQQMTDQIVKQIQAQKDYYSSLAAGNIPNLPAGLLPPGFSFPGGGQYNIATVNINVSGADLTNPQTAADLVRQALSQIAQDQSNVGGF